MRYVGTALKFAAAAGVTWAALHTPSVMRLFVPTKPVVAAASASVVVLKEELPAPPKPGQRAGIDSLYEERDATPAPPAPAASVYMPRYAKPK